MIIPTLLSITKGAFLTAGLIILLRLLLRNVLSAKAKYYLWLLLALRLMLPTLPQSPWSLMNLIPEAEPTTIQTEITEVTVPVAEPAPEAPIPDRVQAATVQTPAATTELYPEPEVSYSLTPESWVILIWIGGMVILLLGYIALYAITGLQLRHLPDCRDSETQEVFLTLKQDLGIRRNIRLAVGSGGMLGGILRPTIVLPAECYGQAAKPILLHELLHYQYKDLWIYLLLRLVTVVHWFNPLVWLCFHQARQDSEAACDQRVMDSGLVETIVYAQTLYREGVLSRRERMLMQTCFGRSGHNLRRRIAAISRYSGKHLWVTILSLCLAVVVCACTLTAEETDTTGTATAEPAGVEAPAPDPDLGLRDARLSLYAFDSDSTETTVFSTAQQIGFSIQAACDASAEKKTVETTYIIRDPAGEPVLTYGGSKTWPGDWTNLEHTGVLPEIPQTPGEYSFEVYFDNALIAEATFSVIAADEMDTFFAQFHELDQDSMMDYVEANPEVLRNGWSQLEINEAGLDDAGTGIFTKNGHQVLAIDAQNGILLLRVYCNDSRGVMAILKDSSRLINAPAGTVGSSGQTVDNICEDHKGLLAINGSAFLDDGNSLGSQLAGLAVCQGDVIGESLDGTYKRLELRDDGRMYIVDSTSAVAGNTLEACEFKPALIVDSQILVDETCGWTSPSPRTVIGQSAYLETMLVVIEGRMLDSPGCSVVDIAALMAEYGCAQALNLDGGTSSIMYYKGEFITRCSNTALPSGRSLPTAWVYQ